MIDQFISNSERSTNNNFVDILERKNIKMLSTLLNQALCICLTRNHTNVSYFFGFCLKRFRQVGPTQRVDCSAPMENKREVSFQSRTNNALLVRKSNWKSATNRSLTCPQSTKLSPPLKAPSSTVQTTLFSSSDLFY